MQELALLMPGAATAEQLPTSDLPVDANSLLDGAALTDAGAAGIAGDAAAQQHPGATLAQLQAGNVRSDDKPVQDVTDLLEKARGAAAVEQSAVERGAVEQDAIRSAVSERRELQKSREAEERMEGGKEKIEGGSTLETLAGAFVGSERGAAAPAAPVQMHTQMHASPAGSALEGLSATALAHKWVPANAGPAEVPSTPATARIDTPLGAPGWGEAFQQKIVWLVDRQQQSAELHVNPPNLGPVEVMLEMREDGTHIAFCSPHAAVREAIEANLSDLRTAMGERGLSLGEAMVSSDSSAARQHFANDGQGGGNARHAGRSAAQAGGATLVGAEAPRRQVTVTRSLVDTFA
jgi:flagellar hook-length control protein FliK